MYAWEWPLCHDLLRFSLRSGDLLLSLFFFFSLFLCKLTFSTFLFKCLDLFDFSISSLILFKFDSSFLFLGSAAFVCFALKDLDLDYTFYFKYSLFIFIISYERGECKFFLCALQELKAIEFRRWKNDWIWTMKMVWKRLNLDDETVWKWAVIWTMKQW